MLIRIGGKLRGTIGRILPGLEVKLLQYDRLLDILHDIFNHAGTLRHLLLRVPEAIDGRLTVFDEVVDA